MNGESFAHYVGRINNLNHADLLLLFGALSCPSTLSVENMRVLQVVGFILSGSRHLAIYSLSLVSQEMNIGLSRSSDWLFNRP